MNWKGDLPVPFGGPLPSSTTETVEHHGQKEWSSLHQGEDEFWFKTGGKIKQIDIRLMYEHCSKEIHVLVFNLFYPDSGAVSASIEVRYNTIFLLWARNNFNFSKINQIFI